MNQKRLQNQFATFSALYNKRELMKSLRIFIALQKLLYQVRVFEG